MMSGQVAMQNLDYVRFILLLVKEGAGVLRIIIDNGLQNRGESLSEFLRKNKEDINKSKKLYREQKEILYPSSGSTTDISKWDISLLAFFTRKYFTGACSNAQTAVIKIKGWRDKYFHSGVISVDDGDFEDLCNVIRTISHGNASGEPSVEDAINSIKELDLNPALEQLKTIDCQMCERIEGMLGMINGQIVTLQGYVQQTNQEVATLREEVRRGFERDDREATLLPVKTVYGVVNVILRPENEKALLEVIKLLLPSNSPQQTSNSSCIEEKVANIAQDIGGLGGEVVEIKQGSVVFVINCASLTTLMYMIDYFYSPKIRFRLDAIVKELKKKTGLDVELTADILPKSLEEILKKLRDSTDIKEGTQNKTSDLMSKFKALLEKRKRRVSQSGLDLSMEQSQKGKRDLSESKKLLFNIDNHANRCREVIKEMLDMFNGSTENIRQYPNVQAWIKELAEIEKKLEFKPLVIAVIGNTGEGKSSLMNAILDNRDVLPTSGMKACTATVVEVVQSETDFFEAEIEFLNKEEWFDELRKLCEDLIDENGIVTKTPPERNSGLYNSYCKMVALYGEIDSFDILSKRKGLTEWLGRKETIREENLDDFKKEVEKYVEVQEPGTDQCFWPIVKQVQLKLPECDVCSSGAVLVDLPGRGDSDEARNAIAKSYLGKCDRIWIVSSIHRAINDRTAQELLGEHLRSQFYMNGQLDAVSFICTKTDMVNANECKRELKELDGLTKEFRDELSKLSGQVTGHKKEIKELETSIKQERKVLQEAISYLEDESFQDEDESVSCEKEDLENEVKNMESSIKEKEDQKDDLNTKVRKLKDQQDEKIKAINGISAKVRNAYCETRIKEQFASSFEEIKRASKSNGANKELEQFQKNLTNNLKVFCCSSVEYQFLEHREPNDADPKVFSNVDDTQIPKLRNFVHELTSTSKKDSLIDTLSSLDGFVRNVQSYLLDKDVMKSKQSFTQDIIDVKLRKLKSSMDISLEKLKSDLVDIFDKTLIMKLREGATAAAEEANEISNRWGAQRKEGGLHHRTYQAAVKRQGVYYDVDFNEDLVQPIFTKIAFTWGNTFMGVSGSVWKALEGFKDVVLQERKKFLDKLLRDFGIPENASKSFREAQECIASVKINSTVKAIQNEVALKHRDIHQKAAPHIKSCLSDVYKECAEIKGKGMLEKVKTKLTAGIREKHRTMFNEIADAMTKELHALKQSIVDQLTQNNKDLITGLSTALEPLCHDNTILRSAFRQAIRSYLLKVERIKEDFECTAEGPSQKK